MIRIEVTSTDVNTKSVIAKKAGPNHGKQFTFHEQPAWAYVPDKTGALPKYPTRMNLSLEDNQPPYEPGFYVLQASSIYVDAFGSLTFGKLVISKQTAANVKAA